MSADRFSLFDDTPALTTPVTNTMEALDEFAFLYTATEKGNSTGIKFMASRADAMRWCSDPASRGVLLGTAWAYFWTSVPNFLRHHCGDADTYGDASKLILDLSRLTDNGEWDERIAAAGCRMIKLDEIAGILEPLGVEVIGSPKVTRRKKKAA